MKLNVLKQCKTCPYRETCDGDICKYFRCAVGPDGNVVVIDDCKCNGGQADKQVSVNQFEGVVRNE